MYSENVQTLSQAIQNGKGVKISKHDSISKLVIENDDIHSFYENTVATKKDVTFPTNFRTQFCILLSRMFLQMKRNKSMLWIQLFHHILSGLLVGGIFYGIGEDAGQMIANFKYCMSVVAFFMYTYVMVPVLICKC